MNLRLSDIAVKYSHKVVLNNVSTEFAAGQIHMLIGENGAGKSTLTKVICGDILPTSGQIFIDGQQVQIKNPQNGIKKGIVCVHQNPLLAKSISVKENLILGLNSYDKDKAETLLKKWLPDVKMGTLVRDLGGDQRFFTAFCGALLKNPKLLILDEPSALLDLTQRELLFESLKQFASDGMNIIVITHNMDEAKKYADTITYLENGVITTPKNEFLNQDLNALDSELLSSHKNEKSDSRGINTYIKFTELESRPVNKPSIFNINFKADSGEITLVCGAAESGRETLEDVICGMNNFRSKGQVTVCKENKTAEFKIKSNYTRRNLEKSDVCFGIIPSNKNYRASNPKLTVLQLLTSGIKGSKKELEEYARLLIQRADIQITTKETASCLSGGMLQRLILERELAKNPDILILCEPVQGLDVLSSQKLCTRLIELAQQGKVVLVLSSSEFPKEICEKVYDLQNGFIKENV